MAETITLQAHNTTSPAAAAAAAAAAVVQIDRDISEVTSLV
jgi:hypothetical protein